ELEAGPTGLSIATFRFAPPELIARGPAAAAYLDDLNQRLLGEICRGGEAFLSNAVVGGRFLLRACIVNFRTTEADVDMIPPLVARLGRALDAERRPDALKPGTA